MLAGLAALLCAVSAVAGAATPPVSLRIAYLPNLVYDGERLTLCGAVVNRTAHAVRGHVVCTLAVPGGADHAETRRVLAPPAREGAFRVAWRLAGLKKPAALNAVLTVDGREAGRVRAAVYPASLELPELSLSGAHLADADGNRAVLVVRRQIRQRESEWGVVKLVERTVTGGKVEPASALFVGDLLAAREEDSYVALLKADDALARFTFISVPHPADSRHASHAVLQTLCAFSKQSALSRRHDFALFFVGSEEARFGTDVDEFRKAVDLMCGLLRVRGTPHVAFIAPVAPPPLAGRPGRYRRAIKSVAHRAAAKVHEPQAAVARAGWGSGRAPGPDATRAIADEIIRFVRANTIQ